MRSHELARVILEAEDGEVVASMDISTESKPFRRCFGDLEGINCLPSDEGFGNNEVVLLFSGYVSEG